MELNPEHHVKIIEALIVAGGMTEIQTAPGRKPLKALADETE